MDEVMVKLLWYPDMSSFISCVCMCVSLTFAEMLCLHLSSDALWQFTHGPQATVRVCVCVCVCVCLKNANTAQTQWREEENNATTIRVEMGMWWEVIEALMRECVHHIRADTLNRRWQEVDNPTSRRSVTLLCSLEPLSPQSSFDQHKDNRLGTASERASERRGGNAAPCWALLVSDCSWMGPHWGWSCTRIWPWFGR